MALDYRVKYLKADGTTEVASPSDPLYHFTQIGNLRTHIGGPAEILIDDAWVEVKVVEGLPP